MGDTDLEKYILRGKAQFRSPKLSCDSSCYFDYLWTTENSPVSCKSTSGISLLSVVVKFFLKLIKLIVASDKRGI